MPKTFLNTIFIKQISNPVGPFIQYVADSSYNWLSSPIILFHESLLYLNM